MSNIPKLTAAYAALRAKRKELTDAYDEKDRALSKAITEVERQLLAELKATGTDTVRNDSGIFTKTTKRRFHGADWQAVYDYILETKNFGLLQKRLGEGAIKEIIETTDGKLPPGVGFTDTVSIHYTKPKA